MAYKDPEKRKARRRVLHAANPERRNMIDRANYAANPEKFTKRARAWRVSHPDYVTAQRVNRATKRPHVNALQRSSYVANAEKRRAAERRRRAANRIQVNASVRFRYAANPSTALARNALRRARKRGASILGPFTAAMWAMVKRAWKNCCAYCGTRSIKTDRSTWLTQDHITPLSKGGAHVLANIVPCCRSCNSRKGTGRPLVPVQPLLF